MKKKFIVIPVIVLVLALVGGTVMTVCTTDFMLEYYTFRTPMIEVVSNGEKNETYDMSKFNYDRAREFVDLRYKIEPNVFSLERASAQYSPYTLVQQVENGLKIPEDSYKKGIAYHEAILDMDSAQLVNDYSSSEGAVYPSEEMFKANYISEYIWLLYLDGQVDKMKEVTDEYIASLETADSMKTIVFFSSTFSYVYNNGNNADKTWVLETEQLINEKKNALGMDKTDFKNSPIDYSYIIETESISEKVTDRYGQEV